MERKHGHPYPMLTSRNHCDICGADYELVTSEKLASGHERTTIRFTFPDGTVKDQVVDLLTPTAQRSGMP